MSNILMLTRGTGGDVYPFVRIGSALKERGHHVSLAVDEDFMWMVKDAGLDGVPLDEVPTLERWLVEQKLPATEASHLLYHSKVTISIIKLIQQHYRQRRPTVVSHYGLHLPVQMAAERLGIDYMPVFTAPYFMLSVALLQEMYMTNSASLNHLRVKLGLPPVPVRGWLKWLTCPPRSIGLWPEWYASGREGTFKDVESVGFISHDKIEVGELPADFCEWLNAGEPPVLITHGTSIPERTEFFQVSADGCRAAGRRAVIVAKDEKLVAGCLSDTVKYYPYLPFGSLLPHLSAIIHHGGMGTSAQAIAAGVPQLILPCNSDRPDNAERLKQLKVADYLAPRFWDASTVTTALRNLLNSSEVKQQCAAVAQRISPGEAVNAACDVIEDFGESSRINEQEASLDKLPPRQPADSLSLVTPP